MTLHMEPGQESAALPAGFDMASADYGREGADLVVTAPDGASVTLVDYFAGGAPATLMTPDGATISGSVASKLAGPLAPGQVAQDGPGEPQTAIGQVDTLDGHVTATRADGTTVELSKGDPVFEGDVLVTGDGGAVGIVLADTSVFSLGENGRMVLDEMVYDPGAEEGSASFALLTGAATFVSGQIAKFGQDAMMVKTPVATIGIRGTKVFLETDGETVKAVNLPENTLKGESVGEIVLMSPDGDMLGTINNIGGGWQWSPSQSGTPTALQLSDAQVRSIVQETSIHLPQTLEERALEVMDRLEEIRTDAAAARESGDMDRADALEQQAQEMEARVEQALLEVETNLGYKINITDEDQTADLLGDLENFDTAAGPVEVQGDTQNNGNAPPPNPFSNLFNQQTTPTVPNAPAINPQAIPPSAPPTTQGQQQPQVPVSTPDGTNTVTLNTYEGTVVDGYIEDALVFVDADNDGNFDHNEDLNGNGILDAGEDIDQDGILDVTNGPDEAHTFSDANGAFTITTDQEGSLRAILGTDVTTELPLYGLMSAPNGSTVISPLTTLVDMQMQGGVNAETAESNIVAAMGLPPGTDLLNTDPQAAALAGNVALMAKSVMVASTLSQMSAALEAAGLSTIDAMTLAVQAIGNAADGGVLNLTSAEQLGGMLNNAVNAYNAQQPEGAPALSAIDAKIINGMSAANSRMETLLESFEPGGDTGAFLSSLAESATFAQGSMVEAIRAHQLDQLPQSEDAFSYASDPEAPWNWAEGMAPGTKEPGSVAEKEPNHIDQPQTIDRGAFGHGETVDTAVVEVHGTLGTYNTGNHQEYNDAFTFEVKQGESLSLSLDNPNVEMRIYAADSLGEGYDHDNPPPSLDPAGLGAGTYVVMVLNEGRNNADFSITATLDVSGASMEDRFDLFANSLPEQEQNYMKLDGTVDSHVISREDFGAVSDDMAGITVTGSLANYDGNEDKHNDAFQFDMGPGEWVNISHSEGADETMRFQLFKLEDDGVNTRLHQIDGLSPEDGGFQAYSADGGSYVLRIWSEGASVSNYALDISVGGERALSALTGGELTDGLYWDPSQFSTAELFSMYANEVPEIESNYMKLDGTLDAHEIGRDQFGTVTEDLDGLMITGSLADNLSNLNKNNDAFQFDLQDGEWVSIVHPQGAAETMRFELFRMEEDGSIDTTSRPIEGWAPEDGTFSTQATEGGTYVLRVWSEGASVSNYEVDVAIGSEEALADLTGQPLSDNMLADAGQDGLFNIEALIGGDFGDMIIDSLGDDILTGGDGATTFVFDMDGDTDVITNFDFDDVMELIGEDLTVQLETTENGDPMLVVTSAAPNVPETRIILEGASQEDVAWVETDSGYSVTTDPNTGGAAVDIPSDSS
ncbi:hypothetical protein JCM17960_21350 [Magnetospira thiophila]